jgi:hypothetical protein
MKELRSGGNLTPNCLHPSKDASRGPSRPIPKAVKCLVCIIVVGTKWGVIDQPGLDETICNYFIEVGRLNTKQHHLRIRNTILLSHVIIFGTRIVAVSRRHPPTN